MVKIRCFCGKTVFCANQLNKRKTKKWYCFLFLFHLLVHFVRAFKISFNCSTKPIKINWIYRIRWKHYVILTIAMGQQKPWNEWHWSRSRFKWEWKNKRLKDRWRWSSGEWTIKKKKKRRRGKIADKVLH